MTPSLSSQPLGFRPLRKTRTEPGDQASCVAWATSYALKSYQKNREYRMQGLKSDFHFSPAFVYNQINRESCQSGSTIVDALNIIESVGALPLDAFPYSPIDCKKLPTPSQLQSAWEFRIAKWMRVNVQSLQEIKAQIARGFPIIVGMNIYKTFSNYNAAAGPYKTTVAKAGDLLGGHAMLIVGYADQIKSFKLINSWGKDWGDGGFAWIDYETFLSMVREGYVTVDIVYDRVADRNPALADLPNNNDRQPENSVQDNTPPEIVAAKPGNAPLGAAPPLKQDSETLTKEILAASLRSTTAPKVLFTTSDNFEVRPYSIWLELPDKLASKISRVEYWFNHPTFVNPKKSEAQSNIFLAKWRGYACILDCRVDVVLKSGEIVKANFDLCDVQARTSP